jgi:PPOX class probable F420-dependent enzyme
MRHKSAKVSPAIRKKLSAARVARLATLGARLRPHLVPVCFVYDSPFFYTAVDHKPKRLAPSRLARLKNISATPQVALLIDEYHEDWSRLWYVMVRGDARLISSPAERKRALHRLRAKYRQYAAGMLADDAPIIRITPEQVTVWGKI